MNDEIYEELNPNVQHYLKNQLREHAYDPNTTPASFFEEEYYKFPDKLWKLYVLKYYIPEEYRFESWYRWIYNTHPELLI